MIHMRHTFLLTLLAALIVLVGINLFGRQSLPQDPQDRIARLQEAERYQQAETIFESLLTQDPLDLDLNYRYIVNHFQISPIQDAPRDDAKIESRYTALAAQPESADVGHYGLGLLRVQQEKHQEALDAYQHVNDPTRKYLNNSIGYVYLALEQKEQAVPFFFQEIALEGNVAGAVANLVSLYLEQGDDAAMAGIRSLAKDERTAPYVGTGAQRLLAYQSGQVGRYLQLTLVKPLEFIQLEAALSALIICAMWFFYFWRIDVFEQEPLSLSLAALSLGAVAALGTALLSDTLYALYPLTLGEGALNDLIYSLLYIGAVEEVIKFLPVLAIVLLFPQVNEPIDLLIYGSLSALGFATLENSLYFTGYGLSIVFIRFLVSTMLHMALTSIVCYSWARARYIRAENAALTVLGGLVIAALVHGLFDYFILGPIQALSVLSFLLPLVLATVYGRMINTALNFSPYFDQRLAGTHRLSNYALLLSTAVVMLLIAYLYNNFYFSTEIANERLLGLGGGMVLTVAAVLGALGQFGLERGRQLSLWRDKSET
jgi:protease PrsW